MANITHPQMRTFDINKFNQFKDSMNIGVADYTLDDGSLIHANKFGGEFQVIRQTAESPYYEKYFYYSNLTLEAFDLFFYDIQYGTSYQFDTNGKIIKQFDEDYLYKFTINDLMKELLNKYDVDLMKPNNHIQVTRYINDSTNLPEYDIRYPSSLKENKDRKLVIDGNDGHIIEDKVVSGPVE